MGKIDQHSLVPVGIAVLVIGGGSIWMTKQDMITTANASAINALQRTYEDIGGKLSEILERLSSIEGELKRIPKRVQRQDALPDRE